MIGTSATKELIVIKDTINVLYHDKYQHLEHLVEE